MARFPRPVRALLGPLSGPKSSSGPEIAFRTKIRRTRARGWGLDYIRAMQLLKKGFISQSLSTMAARVAPELKLRWDLQRYDAKVRRDLAQMRGEQRTHEDLEEFKSESNFLRKEIAGPLLQYRQEKLIDLGRKVGVRLEDIYGEQGRLKEDPFEYDSFGSRSLKDVGPLQRAVRDARKDAEKDFRERWAFRFGIAVGFFSLLKETFPVVAKPIIEIVQAAAKAWKN